MPRAPPSPISSANSIAALMPFVPRSLRRSIGRPWPSTAKLVAHFSSAYRRTHFFLFFSSARAALLVARMRHIYHRSLRTDGKVISTASFTRWAFFCGEGAERVPRRPSQLSLVHVTRQTIRSERMAGRTQNWAIARSFSYGRTAALLFCRSGLYFLVRYKQILSAHYRDPSLTCIY